MALHIKIIGVLSMFLALIHIAFPRYFKWKKELQSLNTVNNQMMYVHTFFVALVVFLTGALCIFCTDDLMHTGLGNILCFGLFIFWGLRLVVQFFYYSPGLWRGKKFETGVHIIFSVLWAYFTIVFFLLFYQKG